MKITVRADKVRFSIAVPTGMAAWAVKRMPVAVFTAMRQKVKPPYNQMVTKENFAVVLKECSDILKENRGLEAVYVQCTDGTFVSVVL